MGGFGSATVTARKAGISCIVLTVAVVGVSPTTNA
jgi:hypothetical protein